METTNHANVRMQQRGFSKFVIDMILQFGTQLPAPGGATKLRLGKREYQQAVSEFKKAIQLLDRAKGGEMILSGSDKKIITVYKC